MHTVAVARQAMATRFEIVALGDDPVRLRAAAEEALSEVETLDQQLSLYRNTSEVHHINARAARDPVRVSTGLFTLLERARDLSQITGGAFDITVGPLMRCWGFMRDSGRLPSDEAIDRARAVVGMDLVQLDPDSSSVRFALDGVMIDLGAIGKGYALECAAELLREAGVGQALLHGGSSTVCAIGPAADGEPWKIALGPANLPADATVVVPLQDASLSVSAVWGKAFEAGGKVFGHVIDPRTGSPSDAAQMSAVMCASATESDALSTALLTLGSNGLQLLREIRPDARALISTMAHGQLSVVRSGL